MGSWVVVWWGIRWLVENCIFYFIVGWMCWDESEVEVWFGYCVLFVWEGLFFDVDCFFFLFLEMDVKVDVLEIFEVCWEILGKVFEVMMCVISCMVVKWKGVVVLVVLFCMLLFYDFRFEMGSSFLDGCVFVFFNYFYCVKFCVLGGGLCS